MNTRETPQTDLDPASTPRLRSARTRGRVAGVLIGASALAAATLGAGAIAGAQDTGSAGSPADAESLMTSTIEEIDAGDWADLDPADLAEFEAFDRCIADKSGVEFIAPVAGDVSAVEVLASADAELGELPDGFAISVDDLDLSSVEAVEITDDPELAEMLEDLEAASEQCAPLLPEGAGVAMIGSDGAVVEFGAITATEAAPLG